MESPFATTGRIISEPANLFDDLRIIAGGPARLDTPARELLRSAADELESTLRAFVAVQAQLIETQQRLIAVNDQLLAARKLAAPAPQYMWSLSTGWMRGEHVK